MAKKFVPVVQTDRIGTEQPPHALDQIGIGRFQHKVKVILHQAIRVNLPSGFLAALCQRLEVILAIHVVQKDGLAAIPAAHDMVNSSRIFNSQFAWHGQLSAASPAMSTRKSCYTMV